MKTGQIVKVDEFLTTDPYEKKGQSGEIIAVENDIVTVEFSDGVIGKYFDNALILIEK